MPRQLLAISMLLVFGLTPVWPPVSGWHGPYHLRERMWNDLPSRVDYDLAEHRYYEQLIDREFDHRLDRISVAALEANPGSRAPKVRSGLWAASFDDSPLVERVDDLREIVFRPSGAVENGGIRWTTNSQGMRDRPYDTLKPRETFRIALVGDSIGVGWGIDAEARFESILERAWDERSRSRGGPTIEIVNCAVPGHSPGQRWSHFLQVGLPMNPDLVLYQATPADIDWDERRLRVLLTRGIGWDSPLYREVLARAGARPGGSYELYKRLLKPWHWELLAGVHRSMVAETRSRRIPIVWFMVPRVGRTPSAFEHARLLAVARDAGFSQIADVSDTFKGLDPSTLTVDVEDYHPNEDGHARLATRLDAALSRIPEISSAWDVPGEFAPSMTGRTPPRDPSLIKATFDRSKNLNRHISSGADAR